MQGVIKFYNSDRHFGFIKIDNTDQDIFFHMSNVNYEPVEKNDSITFDIEDSLKILGKKCAININLIE